MEVNGKRQSEDTVAARENERYRMRGRKKFAGSNDGRTALSARTQLHDGAQERVGLSCPEHREATILVGSF